MDHAARRARLLERLDRLGADGCYVADPPNLRYLTGFSGSNGHLVLSHRGGTFLTDGRYTEQARREVPDLDRVTYSGAVAGPVAEACASLGIDGLAFEAEHLTYQAWSDLRDAGVRAIPARGEVEALRSVKDHDELAKIQTAQDVADHALQAVLATLAEGMNEQDVASTLDAEMRRAGAEAAAFATIVAFGAAAAEPHHAPTGGRLEPGDVVKIDMGAVVDGYCSDMTRTVAFGEPPAVLREVHRVVRAAQRAGVERVRPGVAAREVDQAARQVIADAGYGEAFTHPVGHGVGLEVHEAPWLRQTSEETLRAGMVLTVEPGVYLPGVGGVRIEDMVEVTSGGARVMAAAAKDLSPG